jgi:histidine ammonia-lyase
MACHAARRLLEMNDNLGRILGIELLTAAQGIGFRAPLKTGAPLIRVLERLRADIPALAGDRFMSPDLEAAAALVRADALAQAAGPGLLPQLASN